MTEFGRPDVTLCGWQDIKIQLITNWIWLEKGFMYEKCFD